MSVNFVLTPEWVGNSEFLKKYFTFSSVGLEEEGALFVLLVLLLLLLFRHVSFRTGSLGFETAVPSKWAPLWVCCRWCK